MERLGPERGNVVANGDRNLLIFPNLVVNDVMATTVRTFYPVRPDHMEVSAWCIAPAGEGDARATAACGTSSSSWDRPASPPRTTSRCSSSASAATPTRASAP